MAHEVQLNTVHVEALEQLEDDGCHVRADLGKGVVETRADAPLDRVFGNVLAGPADEEVRVLTAEASVSRVRGVDDVVAVHTDAGQEGEAGLAEQLGERRQRTPIRSHERPDIGGDTGFDAGCRRMHEGLRILSSDHVFAEDLAHVGFVVVNFVVADAPPQRATGPGIAFDHLLAQIAARHRGFCGAQDPAIVGEDDRGISGVRGHGRLSFPPQ